MYKRRFTHNPKSANAQYKKPRYASSSRPSMPAALVSRSECKSVDVVPTVQSIDNTGGGIVLLNGLIPGANAWQRIGRKIKMKSLTIRGQVYQTQGGAAPGNDYMRMLLLYDRQPNGALPANADVLTSVTAAGATSSGPMDALNPSNFQRFKVLRDWSYKCDAPAGTVLANQPANVATDFTKEFSFKKFIKLGDLEAHFNNGNAGTVADFTCGSLLLVVIGSQNAANHQYGLQYATRMRFVDF